jgi:DNA excision repair protein ERCC-6
MRTNHTISDDDILGNVEGTPSVVVTNYETLHRLKDSMPLHMVDWAIVVCDEGHKIRNHESAISRLVKRLTADLRVAVSGSPIQNSLVELWSLFDFAVPGLLGTLDVFEREYAEPIKSGGYANANSFAVFRAYTAAVSLRDLIRPFLLRRVKSQVHANLPGKTEQIFFVKLTAEQERAYREFLESPTCVNILSGHMDAFIGIDRLRKICDHPALLNDSVVTRSPEHSAKLLLLQRLLPQWHRRGHRALVFSQYLAMLALIEALMNALGLSYFRIDGKTGTDRSLQRRRTIRVFAEHKGRRRRRELGGRGPGRDCRPGLESVDRQSGARARVPDRTNARRFGLSSHLRRHNRRKDVQKADLQTIPIK